MKRHCVIIILLLTAFLTVSCEKDSAPSPTPTPTPDQEAEYEQVFWSIVGQLTNPENYTPDYKNRTFEPTIGVALNESSYDRVLETNDLAAAASRFANLVGLENFDPETSRYTFSHPAVGTLTYTRTTDETSLATVTVTIRQMPHLSKIVYMTAKQMGYNDRSFRGAAYYRFGDVISRKLPEGETEYWVCVRPAFGPEQKQISRWICVNTLPEKFIVQRTGGGQEWYVPNSGIGRDNENMQNLAEMIYAMVHPAKWEENVNLYNKHTAAFYDVVMPFFTDFDKNNIQYHNRYFWEKVHKAWTENGLFKTVFGVEEADFLRNLDSDGLHFLYRGNIWNTTSWVCTLFEAVYTEGTKDSEHNMHHTEYPRTEKDVRNIKLDCRYMSGNTVNYMNFFNNDGAYRWVIRHSSGQDLASDGRYHVKYAINGFTDVYRYNDYYGPVDLEADPEITTPDE